MIPELFLIAALSLPADNARYAKLKAFLTMYGQDKEVYMTESGAPAGEGWERIPFTWEGFRIWTRRDRGAA